MTKKARRTALLQRDGQISELQAENERLRARLAEHERGAGGSRPGEGPTAAAPAGGAPAPMDGDEGRLYRLLADNATDVIWTVDAGLNLTYVSPSVTRVLGYTPDEAMAMPFAGIFPPATLDLVARLHAEDDAAEARQVGGIVGRVADFEVLARDGSSVWVEAVISPLRDAEGRWTGFQGACRDVTRRRKAQLALAASEERFRTIFERSPIGAVIYGADGAPLEVNRACVDIFGSSRKGVVEGPSLFDYRGLEDDAKARLRAGETVTVEIPVDLDAARESGLFSTDGSGKLDVRLIAAPLGAGDDGSPRGYLGLVEDVTARRQAEEALRASEERLRQITGNMLDAVSLLDKDGITRYASPSHERIVGYRPDELVGRLVLDLIHPDDAPQVMGSMEGLGTAGEPGISGMQYRFRHRDGHYIWGEATAKAILAGDGGIAGYVIASRDITERREAQDALQRQERFFRAVTENSSDGVLVMGRDGNIRYESPGAMRLLGLSQGRTGESATGPIHPDDLAAAAEALDRVLGGQPAHAELRAAHADGSWRTIDCILVNLLDDPAVEGIVVNIRDVTERKRAEEALGESEARLRREEHLFRMLTESSQDLVVLINPDGTIRYESPAVERILGFKPDERVGASVFELLHADDAPRVVASYARLKDDPRSPAERYEIRLRHRDGSWRTIDSVACVIAGEGGVEGVMVNLRDITDRKKAEEALREAKEYAEYVVRTASVLVVVLDREGRATLLNEAGEKITGYRQAEVVGRNWFELVVPREHYPRVWEEFERVRTEGSIVETFENPILTRAGEERIISWKNSVLVRGGHVAGTLSFGRDITEERRAEAGLRKAHAELEDRVEQRTAELKGANQQLVEEMRQRQQVQDRLQESESRYRGLVESANSIIMELDTRGRVTFFNRFAQEFYGFGESEILGRPVVGTIAPPVDSAGHDTRAAVRDLVRRPEQWGAAEGEGMRRNGERVWISWTNKGLHDSAGRLRNVLCIGMDRTEQRRTSDLLAEQLKEKAAAEERQRLARELHDAVTQMLFSASIIAGVLPRLWERDREEARRRLEELRQLTRGALAEMRLLLLELRPAAMAEVGLADLLRHLAEATSGRAGFPVSFSMEGQCALPPDVQMALYRVAQEALANATKHSRATEARVHLLCDRRSATLVVSDNGCGFDPKKVSPEHLGLRIMQERAEAAGAELVVTSSTQCGTEVKVGWSGSRRKGRA